MQRTLIVRLVDITLLLLLSLMAVASIDPYAVDPPDSRVIQRQGTMLQPLQVAVTAAGRLVVLDESGGRIMLTPASLARQAASGMQGVEVVADRQASAQRLLEVHQALDAQGVPAAFLVVPAANKP